jgi:tetratricopeptide (TPR) repeat protein
MTSVNERLNLLLDLRRFADAEAAAREAIGRDPQWAAGYTHLARALMGLNKPEAIDAAREGARKAPQDAWAVGTLACALNWFRRYKEALEPAEQTVKLDPRYAWGHAMLANILFNLDRLKEARDRAIEGLRFDPLSESLIRWKGWAEHKLGQNDEALATAELGLKHHPNSHLLLNLIGCIKWVQATWTWGPKRLRMHREADTYLRESMRLDPTCPAYRENLRGNAVSCRGSILVPLVIGLCLVACVVPVSVLALFVLRDIEAGKGSVAVIFSLLVLLITAVFATSGRCALVAPLDRFGLPTVALPPRERQLAVAELYGYAVLMLVPYGIVMWAMV